MKLLDYDCTRSTSQQFTEKIQEQVFVTCLSHLFNAKHNVIPLYLLQGINKSGSIASKY